MKRTKCEVYSRVVGYIRPVTNWNIGKQEEFKDRQLFDTKEDNSQQHQNQVKNLEIS